MIPNRIVLTICFLGAYIFSFAQQSKHGIKNIATSEVINEFSALSVDALNGDNSITVINSSLNTNNRFSGSLESGDLILIIQMQGVTITSTNNSSWGEVTNVNNCGNYELLQVANVPNGTTIELDCDLKYDYSASGHTQIVRVPRYESLTVNNSGVLTTDAWDGSIGGVLAVEVKGVTTVDGLVDATGTGFRGGQLHDDDSWWGVGSYVHANPQYGARKGEGLVGYDTDYVLYGGEYGRGAGANAGGGGNAHNAGGGGGANGGLLSGWNGNGNPDLSGGAGWTNAWNLESAGFAANTSSGGGRGGYSFSATDLDATTTAPGNTSWTGDYRRNVGGKGGRPNDYSTGRLFLGGGGGAGDQNDNVGGAGGTGGGLILMMTYDDVNGSGSFISNGEDGQDTQNSFFNAGKEGAGGAGSGGTIFINAIGIISGVTCIADGGNGGDHVVGAFTEEVEGPGGGGGGGHIALSNAISISVLGGDNGTTNSPQMTEFTPNGATKGGDGSNDFNLTNFDIVLVSDTICSGVATTLTAQFNGIVPPGSSIDWFDSPSGGNFIYSGNSLTTGIINNDTVFYVGTCPGNFRQEYHVVIDPDAIADAGEDTLTCVGVSIDLNGSGGDTYAWTPAEFLNDTTLSSPTATITADTWFYLDIIASNGCMDRDSVFVALTSSLPVTITSDTTICFGDDAVLTASGGSLFTWTPSSIIDNPSSNVINASPLVDSWIYVDVANSAGCTGRDSTFVTVHPEINYTISNDSTLCESQCMDVVINASNGGGGGFTYSWDNSVGATNSFNTCPSEGIVYHVDILDQVTGCELSDSVDVQVSLFEWGFETDSLCEMTSINFSDTSSSQGGNLISWNWDFGDSNSASGENPVHSYNSSGTYTVSLELIDDAGCNYTESTSVIINDLPQGIISYSDPAGCIDFNVSLTTGNNTADVYQWNVGNHYYSTEDVFQLTLDSAGVYPVSVVLTSIEGCDNTLILSDSLEAYSNPIADFQIDSVTYFVPGEQIITENLSLNASSYLWNLSNGESSDATTPIFSFQEEGTYCITMEAMDNNGCLDTTEQCFDVVEDYEILIPNIFSPNGDGYNDLFEITGTKAYTYHLLIYDRWGVLVFESTAYDNTFDGHSITGAKLSEGVYYYTLTVNEDNTVHRESYIELIR